MNNFNYVKNDEILQWSPLSNAIVLIIWTAIFWKGTRYEALYSKWMLMLISLMTIVLVAIEIYRINEDVKNSHHKEKGFLHNLFFIVNTTVIITSSQVSIFLSYLYNRQFRKKQLDK